MMGLFFFFNSLLYFYYHVGLYSTSSKALICLTFYGTKLNFNDMGKFIITTDRGGEYRFNLKARNGETILSSEGYTTKASCRKGMESVMENASFDERFERKNASNGSPYFNLLARNGQVIGTSEGYSSESAMETGIASVKKNAPGAGIEDRT